MLLVMILFVGIGSRLKLSADDGFNTASIFFLVQSYTNLFIDGSFFRKI